MLNVCKRKQLWELGKCYHGGLEMRLLYRFDVTVESDNEITEEELFNHIYKLKQTKKFKGARITCLDKED